MNKALEAARALVKMLEENEKKTKGELSTLNPGEVFKIGEHDFIVLAQEEGQTKVISKGFMAKGIKFDSESRDYNISNLCAVMEEDIQPLIEAAVGEENLIKHEVELISVDMQQEFEPCKCKVRPVTFDEATQRSLALNWGVTTVISAIANNQSNECELARAVAREHGIQPGESIILVAGYPVGNGATNTMKIIEVK